MHKYGHESAHTHTPIYSGDQGGCEMIIKGLQSQISEAKVLEVRFSVVLSGAGI